MTLSERLRATDLVLFDLDGTLYRGENIFDFTAPLLDALKAAGKSYRFLTNNSSRNLHDYVAKMTRLGIRSTEDDFLSSGSVTVQYLLDRAPGAAVFLCGTASLKEQFRESGILLTENAAEADAVVIACDTELTFRKIDDACRELTLRDPLYLGTHPDMTCPSEYGEMPDCGALARMIEAATGKYPLFLGKPAPAMPELAMRQAGIGPDRTVIVGDRLDTDIESGFAAGIGTVLVMSGSASEADLAAAPRKPDFVLPDAGALLTALTEG